MSHTALIWTVANVVSGPVELKYSVAKLSY